MELRLLAVSFACVWLAYTWPDVSVGLAFVLGILLSSLPVLGPVLSSLLSQDVLSRQPDAYPDLDHLVLNVHVPTCWLNLGDWERTSDFPTACEALAIRTAKAAHLERNLRILDVGCGTGQSLQLWHSQYQPAKLVGVTLSPQHAAYGRRQLPADVALHAGDAIKYTSRAIKRKDHFDRILAIDCAYHFKTRALFLQCAFDALAAGGRIGLADMVISPYISGRSKLALRILLKALAPWENMVTEQEYLEQLEKIGFKHIVIDDITSHVFPGAATFLANRSSEPAIKAATKPTLWLGYRAFAHILRWWSNGNVLRYVVVAASKPS